MRRLFLASALALSVACSSSDPVVSDSRDDATIDEVDDEQAKKDAGANKDAGPRRDAGHDNGSTDSLPRDASTEDDTDFTQCADKRVEAERQPGGSNVVWAIDTSGSMKDEAELVQQNLNRFVEVIESAGLLDYRVVLVTERNFVTIPDPLGSDMTHFLHVEENVGSDEPLTDLINRFPDYKDFLLPGAITHFVTVTDDESEITAEEFVQKMELNLGKTFRSHAIASPPGDTSGGLGSILPGLTFGGCDGKYGSAARPGDRHWQAAALTKGLTFSICAEDWGGLFSTLAEAVGKSAAVPCTLELPPSPEGQVLDLDRINVVYTPEGEQGDPLRRVDDAASCDSNLGWHYDNADAPTGIVLCPASCELAASGGALQVSLGCNTIIM